MAETTQFTIGARAYCSDGFCGEVSRVVVDPAARAVTHLVIEPKHRREPGRLVPLGLVTTTTGEIRLGCTIAEFDKLDLAEETETVEGVDYAGGYGSAGAVQGYGYASGMGVGMGLGHRSRTVTHDAVPLGETEISRGDHVHATDGEIGLVQGFVVDPGDHHVTHVLLQEGHLWGRKEVAIPISAVTGVDDGIRLSITKQQVEDLPRADIGHPNR